jgi:hypothetical protein
MQWNEMNSAARITVTRLGHCGILMAWILSNDERRLKMATPLFLIAAFCSRPAFWSRSMS